MKQCPVCKNTYTDETLSFCLSDGTPLNDFYDAGATQSLPLGVKPTEANYGRVNIPVNAPSMETKVSSLMSAEFPPQTSRTGCGPFLIAAILGLLGILALAGIGGAYFFFKDKQVVQSVTPNPTPVNSSIPNSNSNEQELKDRLDKLQKQLDDQKKAANKTPPPPPRANNSVPSQTPPQSATTARVNSPSDGFLALRSSPSSQTGYQILKIPHGASVNVYNCQGYTTIGSKTGRWCQVSYSGYNGWAFDAWLIY